MGYVAIQIRHKADREDERDDDKRCCGYPVNAGSPFRSRTLDRKRPPAGARADYDTALSGLRAAGKARFDFEMGDAKIVDIATLPVAEWALALR